MAERSFGRAKVERSVELRQRNARRAKSAETPASSAGGGAPARLEAFETALRALKGMGFREADVRRVLASMQDRAAAEPPSIESVLREGIRLLTA